MAPAAPIAGRYELRALLLDDGVKQVWAGYDRQLDREVGVEVATTDDAALRERFLARARLLAAENHPHLATVYDTGVDDGHAYAVLEPLMEGTLAARLSDGPPFSLTQVVDLGIALTVAASAALQRELAVEPLDPSDILLRDGNHVKLANLLLRPRAAVTSEEPLVTEIASLLVAAMQPPGTPQPATLRASNLPAQLPATLRTIVLAAIATRGASIRTLAELRRALTEYRGAALSTTRAFHPVTDAGGDTAAAVPFVAATVPHTRTMPAAGGRHGGTVAPRFNGRSRRRPTIWLPVFGLVMVLLLIGGAVAFAEWLGTVDAVSTTLPPAGGASTPVTKPAPSGGGIVALLFGPSATPRAAESASATPTAAPLGAIAAATATPTAGGAYATATALAVMTEIAGYYATATAEAGPSPTATESVSPTPEGTPTPTDTPLPTPAPPTATPVPTAAVPGVVGRSVADATQILNQAGFNVSRLPDQTSAEVPSGVVMVQNPFAASIVPLGSTISLTASSGPAAAIVPNVVGNSLQAAQSALSAVGLGSRTSQAPSATAPAGTVIGQNPAPGTALQPGSTVALTVSAGNVIAVPKVIGMSETEAQQTIRASGLQTTFPNHSGTSTAVQIGQVESQQPAAGALVPPGTIVYINIRSS